MTQRRVIVIGAGLAGLCAAHEARSLGAQVVLLEGSERAGGKLRTDRPDGWLLEWGPQTFLAGREGALRRAITRAGLDDRVVGPEAAAKRRYVVRKGALQRVPARLPKVLGKRGLLRFLAEPLVAPRREPATESVAAFARRRFGPIATDRLVGAFVSGVFGGDPERLEVESAFPRLAELERDYRSVISAAFRGGFAPRAQGTFQGGMQTLADGLAAPLRDALRLDARVTDVQHTDDGWRVRTDGEDHLADAVVCATPADVTATLLRGLDADLARHLDAIPYAPLAVVHLGYRGDAFPRGLPVGFGFLIPRQEGLRSLGCLYPSSVFPISAPPGHVLLRVMIGGRTDPAALDLDDAALIALARRDVEPLADARAAPILRTVFRHPRAIPQYELGHRDRLAAIDARLTSWPGLHLAGNPYRGVSVPDTAEDGERAGRQAAQS